MAWVEDHAIFGRKGAGKSALGLYLMRQRQDGVLWWDPNDDLLVPPWAIEAGPHSSLVALRAALKAGAKVIFHAGEADDDLLRRQVAVLCQIVKEARASFRVDECHLVLGQGRGEPTCLDYARRSRHLAGDFGAYSTNPQHVDNSLMYVGAVLYLFDCPGVEPWLKHYGHDGPAIMERVRAAGDHAFVRVDGRRVDGPYRLSAAQLDHTA